MEDSPCRIQKTFQTQKMWERLSEGPQPFSGSEGRDRTYVSYILLHQQAGSLPLAPPGKPHVLVEGPVNGERRGKMFISSIIFQIYLKNM